MDLFNKELRECEKNYLEKVVEEYNNIHKDLVCFAELLHGRKVNSVNLLKDVEKYINKLANSPKKFEKSMSEIDTNCKNFEKDLKIIKDKIEDINMELLKRNFAGIAAGIGAAAVSPTIAIAVATTFGTASTGTAIASLSGAAATNAAVAWLGGGALVAGGGGMAAGNALLALAGPLGWTIGAGSIAVGGVLFSRKNRRMAEEMKEKRLLITHETGIVKKQNIKIKDLDKRIYLNLTNIADLLDELKENNVYDYLSTSEEEKEKLQILVNTSVTLSYLIDENIGDDN